MDTYEKLYREFHWETPQHFNFGATIDSFASDPDRVALLWEDQDGNRARLTFADISAQSNRIANVLVGLGIKRGDPVMIVLPRIALWQAAYTGALIAGTDTADLVADLRGACPSITRYLLAGSERTGWACVQEAMQQASSSFKPEQTHADEPAICYYTSGTTKDPKAVLHGHAYTWAHRYTGLNWLDLKPGDMHWTTSDTGWAKAAYGVLFGPWMNGIPVFMFNGRFDPERELDLLARCEVSVFCAPPTEYRLLVKQDLRRRHLPRLRHCTGAGEPLNPEVIHAWHDALGLLIHDGYGQTETILLAANLPGLPIRPGSMGKPFPGHDLRVIGEEGAELPPGEVGELALRGRPPSLFREYWKSPEETAACRRGEWYLTGDRARRDADGYLWFVGRADDVIISAGYRIGPFEVESALLEHPAVVESAVVASPDAERGEIVKAFVVLGAGHAGNDALATELQEHVKQVTAPYKYPRAIEFVESLPKTVSGKIRRVELRQRESRKTGPGGGA